MLHLRLIFGPILVALLIGCGWLDIVLVDRGFAPGSGLFALAATAALLASRELARFIRHKQLPVSDAQMIGCTLMGISSMMAVKWGGDAWTAAPVIAICLVLLLSTLGHAIGKQPAHAMSVSSAGLLACVYLGLLPGLLLWIRIDHGVYTVAALILIVKSCDIGAYFTGRAIGRHKLIFWLSPGKTWEGLIGGMILSAIVANLFLQIQWIQLELTLTHRIVISLCGALLGGLGQAGDLMASMFKRDAQLKDSGNTIPGFGGVLDVIDSPFATAPVMWLMMKMLSTCC